MIRTLLSALAGASLLVAPPVLAQSTPLDATYDASVPSMEDFGGYRFGQEMTTADGAVAYLRELAEIAPDRIQVFDYATSWQGRTLVYAVIGRPENIARMDEIQADMARLAYPAGLSDAQAEAIIADLPAIVWLSYGVHGDEITSTDAGLRTAYHLLAAEDDPTVEAILDNTIIIVDPVQNPDGRARFIQGFTEARGLVADENRYSLEHDQDWPRGRFNHYLFDLNRDWFAMTQPETQGRVREMLRWYPQVVVDAHEMGGDSSYFFAPSAEPFNPNILDSQREAQAIIGRNNARYFDTLGYDYFTREIFDAFYPGYGDMWPTLQGAVAMTYEQASPRGLFWRKRDGSLLTYADGVDHHFVSSVSTAEAVAENRELFLRNFLAFRRAGAPAGANQAILLDRSANPWNSERLARALSRQGIAVERLDGAVSQCGANYEDGAFLVRFNQPAGRLARTLLEPTTDLPREFVVEQEARRDRGLDPELYDVTAWALPLMHNVDATVCRRAPGVSGRQVAPNDPLPQRAAGEGADWGYAIPWTDAGQAALVAALTREGIAMRTTKAAFRIGDRNFPAGSVVVPRHGAAADLDFTIIRLARELGAEVFGMASSWVDDGPNPGSGNFHAMVAPRVAMAWSTGTSATSAGPTRFVLEQRFGIPVSIIRTTSLASADLSRFDVIILPEQGFPRYDSTLGSRGSEALSRFVQQGGTLVGLGNATRWLADGDNAFLPLQRERAAGAPRDAHPADAAVVDGVVLADAAERQAREQETGAMPASSPGALVNLVANPDAWMASGYENGAAALVTGSDIYAPVQRDEATTALRFAGSEDLLAGGYLWAEYAEQLAQKPFLVSRRMGRGHVIAFTQSPTTRAYLEGLDLMLLNAVLLGPAHSRALR